MISSRSLISSSYCRFASAKGERPAFSLDSVLRGARSAGGWKGRQFLLVLQIALCTLLLAGAGLLVRSFRQLRDLDPGFASAQVVSFTANPSLAGYSTAQGTALRLASTERVNRILLVEAALSPMRLGRQPSRADRTEAWDG